MKFSFREFTQKLSVHWVEKSWASSEKFLFALLKLSHTVISQKFCKFQQIEDLPFLEDLSCSLSRQASVLLTDRSIGVDDAICQFDVVQPKHCRNQRES